MSLDADDLLVFARVMEAGSFSRAAERLQLPKSTVSRRVAALEERLGEKVLQRSTRRLTLTDFGQGVLEHARVLAGEVDGALALALHRQQRPTGRLRVSMPADFAHQMLTTMLSEFVRAYPEVQLELDLSPRRVDLIAEGFDIAVRMGELPADSQLAARRLAIFSSGLYASPDYLLRHGEPQMPQALTSMHGLMILSRAGDALPWRLVAMRDGEPDRLDEWVGVPDQRTLANAPDMLLHMARAGLGITWCGNQYAQRFIDQGELVRVLPGWCAEPSTCWAVFPQRRLMPLRTRLFLEAMADTLAPLDQAALYRM